MRVTRDALGKPALAFDQGDLGEGLTLGMNHVKQHVQQFHGRALVGKARLQCIEVDLAIPERDDFAIQTGGAKIQCGDGLHQFRQFAGPFNGIARPQADLAALDAGQYSITIPFYFVQPALARGGRIGAPT